MAHQEARSVVTFAGGTHHESAEVLRAANREGPHVLGFGLASALTEPLKQRGVIVRYLRAEDFGCTMTVVRGQVKEDFHVGTVDGDDWAIIAVAKVPFRDLLVDVDAALRALPKITEIRWHFRAAHMRRDHSSTATSPLDP
jgi:hypothetical protein